MVLLRWCFHVCIENPLPCTYYFIFLIPPLFPNPYSGDKLVDYFLIVAFPQPISGHLRDLHVHFPTLTNLEIFEYLYPLTTRVSESSSRAGPVSHFPNTVLSGGEAGWGSDKLGLNVPWNNWEDTSFSQPIWNHWLLSPALSLSFHI